MKRASLGNKKSSKIRKVSGVVNSNEDYYYEEENEEETIVSDDSRYHDDDEEEVIGEDVDTSDLNDKNVNSEDEELEDSSSYETDEEMEDIVSDYVDEDEKTDNESAGNDENGAEALVDEVKFPTVHPLSLIRNKERRLKMYRQIKKEKSKNKMKERKARRKEGPAKSAGHTIESLREPDQTNITQLTQADNEELVKELELDEFSAYFAREYEPKVLITFSDNPTTKTRKFGLELSRIFPNALVKIRNRSSTKRICKSAIRESYSDVLIINEDRRKPSGLLLIHLPGGPTAHFKVSNVRLTTDIKRDHKEITKHRPELILTNFTTRLGVMLGRMLGALFHQDPQFKGRRAATFHNQRDFIFFRHHRYEFAKDAKRVKLRELGPRFTLKVRSIQEGLFDSKCGDYLWIATNKRHELEASRRRFHL